MVEAYIGFDMSWSSFWLRLSSQASHLLQSVAGIFQDSLSSSKGLKLYPNQEKVGDLVNRWTAVFGAIQYQVERYPYLAVNKSSRQLIR